MAAIQRDIDAAARRKEELDTTKGSLTQKRDAAERTAGRRRQLQEALDAEPPDYAAMLKGKRREKEKLEAQICAHPLKAEELDALRHDIRNAGDVVRRAQTTFDRQGQIIKEAEEGLNELSALETCPYCKSKSKGWKSNLEKELTQRKPTRSGSRRSRKSKSPRRKVWFGSPPRRSRLRMPRWKKTGRFRTRFARSSAASRLSNATRQPRRRSVRGGKPSWPNCPSQRTQRSWKSN
jgi:hypothetical protein